MDDTDAFLAAVLPRMREADTALHSGDPRGRIAMWSHVEPLTLFGAALAHTDGPASRPPSNGSARPLRTASPS